MKKEIELSAATKELKDKVEGSLKELKAYCETDCKPDNVTTEQLSNVINSLYRYFSSEHDYINSRINDLQEYFWVYQDKHAENHTPKLSGASMQKFIDLMGLSDSHQVVKIPIFVTSNEIGNKKKTLMVE